MTDDSIGEPTADAHSGRSILLGTAVKVGTATGSLALLPLRAAARAPIVRGRAERLAETGRGVGTDVRQRIEQVAVDALETPEAERAIDRTLAGPLPEAVARSLVAHRVVERVVGEMLAQSDVDSAERNVATELTDRLLRSPEFHRLLKEVLSSREMRDALTQQTTTFGGELRDSVRRRAMAIDDAAGRSPREPRPYAGLATRGVALAADAVLVNLVFLVGSALVALVASLFGKLRPEWLVGTLVGAGWLLVVAAYFVAFWSTTGRTPGMHLMRLRVVTVSDRTPGLIRSLVRLAGLALAIVPMFAGCLTVLVDRRRRALHDFIARTLVLYDDDGARTSRGA